LPLPFGKFSLIGTERVDGGKKGSHGRILFGGRAAGRRECGSLSVGTAGAEGGL
jgi:hypothetical protein